MDAKETEMLLKEYDILVDLLKHQHVRLLDMYKTFLTSNTILVGVCAVILKEQPSGFDKYLLVLGALGFLLSIVWMLVSERINLDARLRWFQLCYTERCLRWSHGIINSGYDFFFSKGKKKLGVPDCKEGKPLEFPKCSVFTKLQIRWAGFFLALFFFIIYCLLIIRSIYYLSIN